MFAAAFALAALFSHDSTTALRQAAGSALENEAARAIAMARSSEIKPIELFDGGRGWVFDNVRLLAFRAKAELAAGRDMTPRELVRLAGSGTRTAIVLQPTPCAGGHVRPTGATLQDGADPSRG